MAKKKEERKERGTHLQPSGSVEVVLNATFTSADKLMLLNDTPRDLDVNVQLQQGVVYLTIMDGER